MKIYSFKRCRLYFGLLLVVAFFLMAGCETVNIPSPELSESEDLSAKRIQTGSLWGTVKDSSTGKRISGVVVTVVESNLSTQTNALGRYTISRITPGTVTVIVSRDGYVSQTRIVTIRKGKKTILNSTLQREQTINNPTPTPTPAVPVDLLIQYGWGKNKVVRWKKWDH
ncbi:MAG: carboxypeptidase-like regulatory domain-containing protein [Candidatus Caldatribacteriaceae bacterium]